MDDEISNTVSSLMAQTKNLDNIFLYVLVQDKYFPKLEKIFEFYDFKNYVYEKIDYADSKGVGFARSACQSKLSTQYRYFFQIDSHTQFIRDWDVHIVSDYQKVHDFWGASIISTYPQGYEYDEKGMIKYFNSESPPIVRIEKTPNSTSMYQAKYTQYLGTDLGDETGYFCAGQAFGYVEYFLKVPYDPEIVFHGEEQTMSIRFFSNGIQIVCPPRSYVYHDYVGDKRKRGWDTNPNWESLLRQSDKKVKTFFNNINNTEQKFLVSASDIQKWENCFILD